jgi:AraC family ethanolamine operon transcriptional activator
MSALLFRSYADGAVDTTIPGWSLQCVQTSAGALSGGARELHVPGIQLLDEQYRHVVTNHYGVAPAGSIAVVIPLQLYSEGRLNGTPWTSGQVCVWDTDREFNAISPPGDLLVVIVDRQLLSDYIRQTEHLDPLPALRGGSLVFEAAVGPLAASLLPLITDGFDPADENASLASQEAVRQHVLETLAPLLVDRVVDAWASTTHGTHLANVRRVRHLAMAQPDSPLQVQDLCQALQVSRSSLQASFRAVLGMSPLNYLRTLRLDGVRRDLIAGASVKSAVEKWGFWHWSRFSHDYRQLFGELPSQTLRRRATR